MKTVWKRGERKQHTMMTRSIAKIQLARNILRTLFLCSRVSCLVNQQLWYAFLGRYPTWENSLSEDYTFYSPISFIVRWGHRLSQGLNNHIFCLPGLAFYNFLRSLVDCWLICVSLIQKSEIMLSPNCYMQTLTWQLLPAMLHCLTCLLGPQLFCVQ